MSFICSLANFHVKFYNFFVGLFVPYDGIALTLTSLVVSSILIYLFYRFLGAIGGLVLTVIGILGAAVSGGTTLALTFIGLLMILLSKAGHIVIIINIGIFLLTLIC